MTHSQRVYTAALSANDAFKLKYPKYLKGALLAALALTALLLWLWPDIQPNPYQLRQKVEMVWVDVPDPVQVPEPPAPRVAPWIPPVIEAAPDDDPDVEDPGWVTPPFWDPAPIIEAPSYEGFIPSSALPRLTFQAKADYPEIARRSGLYGSVLVHVLVDVHGRVAEAVIIQGAHPILDKAALAAARKCQFTPAKQREIKVKAWVAIPYRFKLK